MVGDKIPDTKVVGDRREESAMPVHFNISLWPCTESGQERVSLQTISDRDIGLENQK